MSVAHALDRRLTPARPDLAAEHLRGLVEAQRYVPGVAMRVAWECAPLFSAPSREGSIDTQALFGEEAIVYEQDAEGWSWLQLARDGYVGYAPSEALREAAPAPTHRLSAARSFVYPAPDMKTPPIGALPLGAMLAVSGRSGDFYALATGGFVFAAHVGPLDEREPDFVAVAERFLHAPYLWGGKTWAGLDCSGLVQIALQASGAPSPRDTDMMRAALGEDVAIDAPLRRGDLAFWRGHIGVMRDETRLLHANGFHMRVASEDFSEACARIAAKSHGALLAVKRLPKG